MADTPENTSVTWDLSSCYASLDDPAIEKDLAAAVDAAALFRSAYRGRIAALGTPEKFEELFRRYEEILHLSLKPYLYASLIFAADAENSEGERLLARARESFGATHEETLFFELELQKLDSEAAQNLLQQLPTVRLDWLSQLLQRGRYSLDEAVEQVISRKDLSGKEGFVQLYDELTAGLSFRFCFPDEDTEREATGEELLALIYHRDVWVRREAYTAYLKGYGTIATPLLACFNNILLDHERESDLRSYPSVLTPSALDAGMPERVVETLLEVSAEFHQEAQRYFRLKARMLGLDRLELSDIYAPVGKERTGIAYPEALDSVLHCFGGFDPRFEAMARRIAAGRIDAFPRANKSGGAFCMGMVPGIDPFVLLNHTGTLRDVTTLAHELGHAVHFLLAAHQPLLTYDPPIPLAETASIFAELLMVDHLQQNLESREEELFLLTARIDEMIATTLRQAMLTRFELQIHAMRKEQLLGLEDVAEAWLANNRELAGDTITFPDEAQYGWLPISHFIHSRFYCFSYVVGAVVAQALFTLWKSDPARVTDIIRILETGGGDEPGRLLSEVGIDWNDPDFWRQGYAPLVEMIDRLEGLVRS